MAKVKCGDTVHYTGRDGFQRAAVVVGTRKSVQDGTAVTRPTKGNVNLRIFSPTGKVYTRDNISQGSAVGKRGTFVARNAGVNEDELVSA